MAYLDDLSVDIDSISAEFTELSDVIWDFPELRWDETISVEKQIATATRHGFTISEHIADLPTAFVAEKGSGGPTIAFLGEYDALADLSQGHGKNVRSGNNLSLSRHGHGCGHNLLGSGSLLAAVATARYLERNNMPGTVRYYGCPAEEAAAGKTFMVRAGVFNDVDSAISWHPMSYTQYRQMETLAYAQVYFHFSGVASHASVSPELGRSALDAVELLNIGTNFLREHTADSSRIHYAITNTGGESPNVVQSQASVYYVVRASNTRHMQELYERVLRVAEGAALMTETSLQVEFDGASSEILPNKVLERALFGNVKQLGNMPFDQHDFEVAENFQQSLDETEIQRVKAIIGWDDADTRALHGELPPENFEQPRLQLSGSTDVGDVSQVTPTVQLLASTAAIGTALHSWQMVAQGKLGAAHKGMIYAAKAMAGTALDLMTKPELLASAREELAQTRRWIPYVNPIPESVLAPPLRGREVSHNRSS